jgi:hypothetical protein
MLGKAEVDQVLLVLLRLAAEMVHKGDIVLHGVDLPNHIVTRTNSLENPIKT